jgi:uncharacterized protein YndB with AHSA1/START domain
MNPNLAFLNPQHSEACHSSRRIREAFRPGDAAIRMDLSIRADARRLFQVLTVPEYLEAWLCLPGHDGCSPAATRIHDDYLLEHSCGDAPAVLITGTYLVCRRRYVMFSWRVDGDLCVPESSVEIRLQGDFERTTLSLEHSGFVSSEAWLWHKALWNASMTRLMRLYDAPDSLDSASL